MDGIIKITGSHDHGDGKPEIVKSSAKASCTINGDIYTITYSDNDRSESGAEAPIHHTLEIGEGTVIMSQKGAVSSELRFGKDMVWHTDYQTPYGILDMTAITRNLMMEISSKKITVHLQYELRMDGEKLSDSKVMITFSPQHQ